MQLSKTKKIVISAVLTAMSFVYIYFVPTLDFGVWSFTPFSHIFIMIGVIISPYVGILTTLTTLLGFMLKTGNYIVWLRAASHIFFLIAMIPLIKVCPPKNTRNIVIVCIVTAVIHATFEVLAVFVGLLFSIEVKDKTLYFIFGVVGGGTTIHSCIDFLAAVGLYRVLRRTKAIEFTEWFDKSSLKNENINDSIN